MFIHADAALARTLEFAEMRQALACAAAMLRLHPDREAATEQVAGGQAVYVGGDSPLTHAVGIGLSGPVTDADIDRLEAFYERRASPVNVDFCPLADPSLLEILTRRGYRIQEWNNVLFRPLAAGEFLLKSSQVLVQQAVAEEAELWSRVMMRGFLNRLDVVGEEVDVGRIIFLSTIPFLARIGEEAAGGGAIAIFDRVAMFFADSTLPERRRRGVQAALIRERLALALSRGCSLAAASTAPGSLSQRNYERFGFRVAYTKAILTRAEGV